MDVFNIVLRNITPVVMSGAHRGDIEFRITEIKGLLRYWYRMPLIAPPNSLAEIKQREDTIWGSTSVASKIGLYGDISSEPTDIKLGNGKRWKYLKKGYPVGSKIHLHVVLYENTQDVLDAFFKSLWALVYLGGIGRSWRKGFGSVNVLPSESDIPPRYISYFSESFDDEDELEDFYKKGLKWLGIDNIIKYRLCKKCFYNSRLIDPMFACMRKKCNLKLKYKVGERKILTTWFVLKDINSTGTTKAVLIDAYNIYKQERRIE